MGSDPAQSRITRLVGARSLYTFGRSVIGATVLWDLNTRTNGDTLVVAGVGVAQLIPVIALFVPAGRLVDRGDRRTLTSMAAMLMGLVGIGLAVASATHAPLAVYFALLLLSGCITTVHAPASLSLIPLIIPREDLERTTRATATLQELAAITGPALAGLAMKWISPAGVYAAVAITALLSSTLYRSLPKPRAIVDHAAASRNDWRVGVRYIFESPLLLPALTLDMFAVLFAGVTALLPVIATDLLHTDSFGYGLLRASQSAGAVVMAVMAARMAPWRRPGLVLLMVVALFGVATIGVGLSRDLWLTFLLLFACGALDNISVVIRLTLEQLVVPDPIRGRVSAVHFVFIGMSNELGAAESGVAASLLGVTPAIVAGGAIAIVVVGLVAVKWRALATMPPLAELRPHDDR